MSKSLFLVHSWYPEESPPQRRFERFARTWLEEHPSATIICSPIDSNYRPFGTDSSILEQDSRNPGIQGLQIYETWTLRLSSSLLSRILDQAVHCLSGAVIGIITGFKRENRPEIVVATVPTLPTAVTGRIIATMFRTPLVIDLRDAWPDLVTSISSVDRTESRKTFTSTLSLFLISAITRFGAYIFKRVLNSADHIVTTSARLESSLRQRGFKQVSTIRNSYNPIKDKSVHRTTSPRASRSNVELRILYAGTVGRAQGLSNALDAAEIAIGAGVQLKLAIIGSGADLEHIRTRANHLSKNVLVFDRISLSDTEKYYQWADACLVHLQDWTPLKSTIPSKLIEIMSRGIPVCVSANGEPADIVKETLAGDYVPAMDPHALAKLWQKWSKRGVPQPNEELVRQWLSHNADPNRTSAEFTRLLETLIRESRVTRDRAI